MVQEVAGEWYLRYATAAGYSMREVPGERFVQANTDISDRSRSMSYGNTKLLFHLGRLIDHAHLTAALNVKLAALPVIAKEGVTHKSQHPLAIKESSIKGVIDPPYREPLSFEFHVN